MHAPSSYLAQLLCILLLPLIIIIYLTDSVFGQFMYSGFADSKLLHDGAASITQDGILSLTTTSPYFIGHGFHPDPLFLINDDGTFGSFSSTFVFVITPNPSGGSGDGMAFVISASRDFSYSSYTGPYLGLIDAYAYHNPPFVAIGLDTVYNKGFKDIDDNHVGIDLSSTISISSAPAGVDYTYTDEEAGDNTTAIKNFGALRLSSGNPMQVWVDYDGESMELNVTLAPVPYKKPSLPLLSCTVNMSDQLWLRDKYNYAAPLYVGFSASTVATGATHEVLGWSFNPGDGQTQPLNYSLLPLRRELHIQRPSNKNLLLRWLPATLSVLTVLAAAAACLGLRWYCWWGAGGQEDWEHDLGPRRFSHKDLRRATDGFSSRRLLGQGGFGRVYGGVFAGSGKLVAVKRICSESKQGLAQFMAEIVILGRLRHRNLVRLIGYCRRKDDELLLVYEHMPNGSLDRYLHDQAAARNTLVWSQRFHIMKGVAAGLLYLHEDWEQVIVHRDIKASNVLLDAEMNGRLGDFGLARLHDHGADAHTTHVAGTRGYLAPELLRLGKATKATDVFAFGAFILEVACGRRPMGLNARGELLVLVEWVRQTWASGCIVDAMDPRLQDYAAGEAELVLRLGLLCSHPLPAASPGMRLVMQYLDGDMPLPEFSPDYLAITDVEQVLDTTPSVANTITSLSGGR